MLELLGRLFLSVKRFEVCQSTSLLPTVVLALEGIFISIGGFSAFFQVRLLLTGDHSECGQILMVKNSKMCSFVCVPQVLFIIPPRNSCWVNGSWYLAPCYHAVSDVMAVSIEYSYENVIIYWDRVVNQRGARGRFLTTYLKVCNSRVRFILLCCAY